MAHIPANPEVPFPALPEFLKLARAHTLIPVCRRLVADLETPVSAFLRLAADEPECFLLESVEGGEKLGRYTFMGVRPAGKLVARGSVVHSGPDYSAIEIDKHEFRIKGTSEDRA